MMKRTVDVLVLGCTHYPVLKGLIARTMGEGVAVIDSADQCADDVARRLGAAGLLHPGDDGAETPAVVALDDASGDVPIVDRERLRCFVTDDADRFEALAPRFLGARVMKPEVVLPERLRAATIRDDLALRDAG